MNLVMPVCLSLAWASPLIASSLTPQVADAGPKKIEALIETCKRGIEQRDAAIESALPQCLPVLDTPLESPQLTAAMDRLVAFGKAIVPHTISGLAPPSKDLITRSRNLARVLARVAGPETVPALLELLEQGDRDARFNALIVLSKIASSEHVPRIGAVAVDAEQAVPVRFSAVTALGEIRDPAGVPFLATALNDEDQDVRQAAAQALAQIDTEEARDAARKRIDNEKNDKVFIALALHLEKHLGQALLPKLLLRAADGSLNEAHRIQVLEMVGRLGNDSVLESLRTIALRELDNWKVREEAARVAFLLGDSVPAKSIIDQWNREIRDRPQLYQLILGRGQFYKKLGNYKNAHDDFQAAMRLRKGRESNPDLREIAVEIARCLSMTGRNRDAAKYLKIYKVPIDSRLENDPELEALRKTPYWTDLTR